MPGYAKTLLLLCAYGFFKELRPSEPYLTEYLIGDQWKGLDKNDVYNRVYPIWPYSYFALLVPVFLLTDLLRYKPVIIFEGVSYIVTWVLLIWAQGLLSMQIMEFFYGIATSTEVAYYTYIYAKVPIEDYTKVSSMTRSAILCGKFSSGLMSQLLSTFEVLDYGDLNYISLGSVSVAFVIGLFLPRVTNSIYFHRTKNDVEIEDKFSIRNAVAFIWRDFKLAYSQSYVVKWSIWVALSTCGNFQIGNYIQALWEEIHPSSSSLDNIETLFNVDHNNCTGNYDSLVPLNATNCTLLTNTTSSVDIYNGAVEAATTLTGALVVFTVGFVKLNWAKWGDVAIVTVSAIASMVLYFMSQTGEIWIAYSGYLLFRMTYQVLMTVATFEIVKNLPRDAYGLIFGLNIFVALGLQTALTYVVNASLQVEIRPQFVIYSVFYAATCLIFVPSLTYGLWKLYRDRYELFKKVHKLGE